MESERIREDISGLAAEMPARERSVNGELVTGVHRKKNSRAPDDGASDQPG